MSEKPPEINPRELWDDEVPFGYMQSDPDWVSCNVEICAWFLTKELEKQGKNDDGTPLEVTDEKERREILASNVQKEEI